MRKYLTTSLFVLLCLVALSAKRSFAKGYIQKGKASWCGSKFHGKHTASGERYNMYAMTAAHKSLPIGTYVEVTRLQNGRSVTVRINDRGPFVPGRIIDLSYKAAKELGITKRGDASVRIRVVQLAETGS